MARDFNNLKKYLNELMDERQMSIEELSEGTKLSRASIYNYMVDRCRPTSQNMAKICHFLGRPLEEGLAQYSERTTGRPRGKGTEKTREVTVRGSR